MSKKKKRAKSKKEPPLMRRDPVKEFLKLLDSNKRLGWFTVFRETVDLMFYGVTRNDPEYLKVVETLGKDYVRRIPEVMGTVLYHWSQDGQARDVLGQVYQEWGVSDKKHFAQYFTPTSVAQMMARMTIGDIPRDQLEKPEGLSVLEPAVGAGVMLLEVLNMIYEQHEAWGVGRTRVVGVDIDNLMCRIAAIQLFWWAWAIAPVGEIWILHGNSLGDPRELRNVAHWWSQKFESPPPPPTGLEQVSMF